MQPVHTTARRKSKAIWIILLGALLLVAAVMAPPLVNLNRLHKRIADSISQGIGRPVRMSSIKMQLLPRPGFEIEDFVVEDDPAFGVEPILHSSQVTAYVRLFPLWRGRLEIARIAFDEPSLNLVRNREGRWNFDSLLSQAAQIPKAPTAERHPGSLPRFPYIDASNARVNFKSGDEKLPFSFFNADLAVWLENPGEWRIQFAAQPVRTDLSLDLANTGTVRLEGSLRRAARLQQMPVQLHAEWSNAPLGQLSRIVAGSDAAWRGELDASADITGNLDHASIKLTASGQNIHRAEFAPREPLNLDVTCQANFVSAGRSFEAVTCLAPTWDGHLLLTGSVHARPGQVDPELSLEINHLPVAMAVDGLRLVRSGFAPAIQANGTIDGNFIYAATAGSSQPHVQGRATVNGLTLVAPEQLKPFVLSALHFTTEAAPSPVPRRHGRAALAPAPAAAVAAAPMLTLEPFSVGQAALPGQLTVSGAFDRSSFSLHVWGQSHIGQLVALGKEFGLLSYRKITLAPPGSADLDLTIRGPWLLPVAENPVAPATLDGTIHLRNAQLVGSFLAQPVEIGSALATVENNRVDWTAAAISYGPIHADGMLSYTLFCETAECARNFSVHIAALDAATAQSALLENARHGELVQRLLDRIGGGDPWPTLSGTAQIGTFTIDQLAIHDLSASVALDRHSVHIPSLTGHALDGSLHLSGTMDASSGTPHYEIAAQIDHASASTAAALFQEKWGAGSFALVTDLRLSGFSRKELASSATGTFHLDWSHGGLSPVSSIVIAGRAGHALPPDQLSLARFDRWAADGTVAQSTLTLHESRIENGTDTLPVTGSVGFDRTLHLGDGTPAALNVSGTMQHPQTAAQPSAPTAARSGR